MSDAIGRRGEICESNRNDEEEHDGRHVHQPNEPCILHARIAIYREMHMDVYSERAEVLRVMAHPIRLRILDILRADSECVCHLSAALGKPQPYVSQQLAVLREAGLVVDEKDGTNSFYRLADEIVARQVTAVLGAWPQQPGDGLTGCHQVVEGCICPKCRHTALTTPCGPSC